MAILLASSLILIRLLQVVSQPDGQIGQGTCPVSWVQYKQKCYRAFSRSGVTWSASRVLCSRESSRLVVIHSAAVNDLVYDLSKDLISNPTRSQDVNSYPVGVIIGLNDVEREGEFIWEDGRPVTYTNWEGQPDNSMGNERCVEMWTKGKWNDYSCGENRSRVTCERKAMNTSTRCPPNWTYGEHKCYKVFARNATWAEAQRLCRRETATLPVVRSMRENTMIRSLTGIDQPLNTENGIPLGLKDRSGKRIFTWEDGGYASFSNWEGQPDNYLVENCVEMWPQGKWNDCSCNYTRHGYVCEQPAAAPRTATRPSAPRESVSTSSKTDTTKMTSDEESSNDTSDVALYVGIGGAVLGLILILNICLLVWCIKRGKLSKSSTDTGTKVLKPPLHHPSPCSQGEQGNFTNVGFSGSSRNCAYETLDDTTTVWSTPSTRYDKLRFKESPPDQAQKSSLNASYENEFNKANRPNLGTGISNRVQSLQQNAEADDAYIFMEPISPSPATYENTVNGSIHPYVKIFE